MMTRTATTLAFTSRSISWWAFVIRVRTASPSSIMIAAGSARGPEPTGAPRNDRAVRTIGPRSGVARLHFGADGWPRRRSVLVAGHSDRAAPGGGRAASRNHRPDDRKSVVEGK